jgi:cytochrome o ubiquinol oxidase subunit 1
MSMIIASRRRQNSTGCSPCTADASDLRLILWTIGFMVTFVLRRVDWRVGSAPTLPVAQQPVPVAHFHHVIIPGVVSGAFAGYYYWPQAGLRSTNAGKAPPWCWFTGFHVAFMPVMRWA